MEPQPHVDKLKPEGPKAPLTQHHSVVRLENGGEEWGLTNPGWERTKNAQVRSKGTPSKGFFKKTLPKTPLAAQCLIPHILRLEAPCSRNKQLPFAVENSRDLKPLLAVQGAFLDVGWFSN